jgi:hypothetical protein
MGVFLSIFLITGLEWPVGARVFAQGGQAKESSGQADFQRLGGRWVRPDGGYVLEVREVTEDRGLKAAYFNPRPIHVARAELRLEEDRIRLLVELRDVHYPGSTYNLQYDPESDRLEGTYFQAVEKQMFDVHFFRAR